MPEVKRNKTTLRKAAKLLQRAHDRIEVTGFDISTYDPSTFYGKSPDEFGGACCYIGNVRLVAGVAATPSLLDGSDAGAGDGPELYLALEAMDTVAKRRLARAGGSVREVEEDYEASTGRFVEALGFEICGKFASKFLGDHDKRVEAEKDYALKLLRTALTEIHKEVENA